MSTDKDFLQLIDDRVKVWSPTKKKLYTKDVIQEEFGIPSRNILTYRILDGDKSDNIDGCIPKCGEKTALKLLKEPSKIKEKLKDSNILDKYIPTMPKNVEKSPKTNMFTAIIEVQPS